VAGHYDRHRARPGRPVTGRGPGKVSEMAAVSSSYTVDEVPPDVLARAEASRREEDDPLARHLRQERLARLTSAAAAARVPDDDAALLVYRVGDTQVVIDALDRISGRTDDGPRSPRVAAVDALVGALEAAGVHDHAIEDLMAEYRYLLNGH
jgi:hypothetical protein